ncbi:hypothetical protein COLO4_37320 [Corchorus olitorius]|uniref:peptide-methionine (S)-S-oxide reductase n=1 Tax=Corchorus olitorius TaxID=93759 RepID=A0A1R3G2C0_9ROSI|nr:hypothetical protein COLO4_37320 [Corchorus olitorius]
MAISVSGFPQLEVLELVSLESLEDLNLEEGAMLRLKNFRIIKCEKLKMLPEEMRSLTALRELDIEAMPRSFVNRIRGEDFYKVRHQFAQFGAGCFWGVELAFQRVPGVTKTEVGYTQGFIHNPTYEDVSSGTGPRTIVKL